MTLKLRNQVLRFVLLLLLLAFFFFFLREPLWSLEFDYIARDREHQLYYYTQRLKSRTLIKRYNLWLSLNVAMPKNEATH